MPLPSPIIRFGAFELDARARELRKRGLRVRLADQPLQVLLLLLERPGEVLTREELRGKLWPADTFVDFDVGLSSAVRKLRDALGDSADNPQFIETLPRRGYRFIAPVVPPPADSDGVARLQSRGDAAQPPALESPLAAPAASGRRRYWWAGVAAFALMLAALAWYRSEPLLQIFGWRTPAAINTLVVLPLENLTGDSSQDYFADGMTDALTTNLVEAGTLQVISRTSAMHYKGTRKTARDIGQELNVDGVLEGAVARSGQHVRITVQLIQAATDRNVWARSYEADVTDIIALQERIARAVVSAIGGRFLRVPAASADRSPVNAEAYDAYLKGLAAGGRGTYEGWRTAVAYFEEAVAKQPDYAEAWAELAQAQTQFLFVGPLPPRAVIPKAEAAARKAVQIDGRLALGHRALGMILSEYYWQWKESGEEIGRARELTSEDQPLGAQALSRANRFDEAIAQAERNRARDPLSFNAYINLAIVCRAARQYDRAIAELRTALTIDPDEARGHFQIAVTLLKMGRLNDAIAELESAVASSKGNPRFQSYLGYAYARAGQLQNARTILQHLETRRREQYVSSFGIALIHDALGEKKAALEAFERAYEDRAVEFSQMSQWPPFETIASDPRFKDRMRAIEIRP